MIKPYAPAGDDIAIVNPVRNKRSPRLGPVAVMVSPKADLPQFRTRMPGLADQYSRIYLSRLYTPKTDEPGISLAGPMVGAPYAVMIMETLIAWGCRQVLFFGWCGGMGADVRIGDVVIPTRAEIDEGTSRHYLGPGVGAVAPSDALVQQLDGALSGRGVPVHKGGVWTTDAVYRETRAKVARYQKAGVLGVDMETAALFTVARYRQVAVAGVLVVSDELTPTAWQPGFKTAGFRDGRIAAIDGILAAAQELI